MELTNGNIPTSVETLSFSQMNSLTIGKDAFYNLHALRNVTLHHIPTVMAEGGGLNMPLGNVLYYFNAISIDDLFIDSRSAIGYWEERTDVMFKDITILNIESKGLHYVTSERGPRITMQNIAGLQLATHALFAPIRILKLENTSMHDCHRETFVSKIDLIELSNATIQNVKTLCFRSVGEHRQMAMEEHGHIAMDSGVQISSSKLGTVHPQAFSGNMPTLKLTRTTIGTIAKQGFQTNVKKFRLTESDIDTLSSEALSVTCEKELVIEKVKIAFLAKNAFMGIADSLWPTGVPSNSLMNGTLNSSCEFELRNVAVENAAVGSLQMPRCLFVSHVQEPHIKSNVIEQCPKKKWARALLGITDLRPMFTDEAKLFDELIKSDPRCDDEYDPELDKVIDDPKCKCGAPDEENGRLKPREGEDAEYGPTSKGEGASDEQDNVPAPKPTELSEDTGANGGGSDTGGGATSVWQHPVWMGLTFALIIGMVLIGGLYMNRRMRDKAAHSSSVGHEIPVGD